MEMKFADERTAMQDAFDRQQSALEKMLATKECDLKVWLGGVRQAFDLECDYGV